MEIFARHQLVARAGACPDAALLLEGSWPGNEAGASRWSLDEVIDGRFSYLDSEAAGLAEAAIGADRDAFNVALLDDGTNAVQSISAADLDALKLRYYFVKLLRVVTFFDPAFADTSCPAPSAAEPVGPWRLHLERGRDDDYAVLFDSLAGTHRRDLDVCWHPGDERGGHFAKQVSSRKRSSPHRSWWRNRLRTLLERRDSTDLNASVPFDNSDRVVLCGNPRLLEPVCDELLHRNCRVWWLFDEFAVRTWWRWRGRGVSQLTCDAVDERRGFTNRTKDASKILSARDRRDPPLAYAGVDLRPAVSCWLAARARAVGPYQFRLVANVAHHLSRVRPTRLVVDEDATPLKRAAIRIARRLGALSAVVQHGVPCIRFGFAPLAADRFCAWGASSKEQLVRWGVPAAAIDVTGPASRERLVAEFDRIAPDGAGERPTFLLLATVPPSDDRPDALSFHLTHTTHIGMLRMACATVGSIPGARLRIKTHPRTRDVGVFLKLVQEFPTLDLRLVGRRPMVDLLAEATCVLSCASSAGIEATLTGRPVIQLLPVGSEDLLPAHTWGVVGTARCPAELERLIAVVLDGRGFLGPSPSGLQPRRAAPHPAFGQRLLEGQGLECAVPSVFGEFARPAAVQIADVLLEPAAPLAPPSQRSAQRPPSRAVPALSSD